MICCCIDIKQEDRQQHSGAFFTQPNHSLQLIAAYLREGMFTSVNRKGCIFHFPALWMWLGVKITQKEPCDITDSLMCTLSPRSPLDENDVHDSFNQILAENSVESVAPSEAFELQQLQWELTEEGEGIPMPSCSLKCHSELERCSWWSRWTWNCIFNAALFLFLSQTASIPCPVKAFSLGRNNRIKGIWDGGVMRQIPW